MQDADNISMLPVTGLNELAIQRVLLTVVLITDGLFDQ
jgi:hypothetical protein